MSRRDPVSRTTCRVLIVDADSRQALVVNESRQYTLPVIDIPEHCRPTEELQKALFERWGVHVIVTGMRCDSVENNHALAIVELLQANESNSLISVPLDSFFEEGISGAQEDFVASYLYATSPNPMFRIGWLNDAIAWIESATSHKVSSKAAIQQLNVGIGFCLMKVPLRDGIACWFKAVGSPNCHETRITRFLSDRNRPTHVFLPELIAFHPGWNALLTMDTEHSLEGLSPNTQSMRGALGNIVTTLARLQIASLSMAEPLGEIGAFDQRLSKLSGCALELCDFVELAMNHQISARAPRLSRDRLRHIFRILIMACKRIEDLELPTTLVHGDLNPGNMLHGDRCVFIDWSEAYIGHPFVCLEHVLLLNRMDDERVRMNVRQTLIERYCAEWSAVLNRSQLQTAVAHMPLLAAASTLYGRGDWLESSERERPARASYARTLARHMDRATCALERVGA